MTDEPRVLVATQDFTWGGAAGRRRNLWKDDPDKPEVWHRARPSDRGVAGCSRLVLNPELEPPDSRVVDHLCRRPGCFPKGLPLETKPTG